MIKIGVFASDEEASRLISILKTIKGVKAVENIHAEMIPNEIDAVCITYTGASSLLIIQTCLKNFKHVFISKADRLGFEDIQQLVKISEESNVRLYPDFESSAFYMNNKIGKLFTSDVQFIDFRQKVSDGLFRINSALKIQLLRNIDLVLSFTKANVKKITANVWPSITTGFGVVLVNLEFDNGSAATISIANSFPVDNMQIDFFTQKETIAMQSDISAISVDLFRPASSASRISVIPENEHDYLAMNLTSFYSALKGMLPGLIDIDNKFNTIRICNLISQKLLFICPEIKL